jgi:UDP-sugar transporter A1/2/3
MDPTINVPGLGPIAIKYVALATLIVQNCGVVLLMRYSAVLPGEHATTSTIVVMQELLKLVLSLLLVLRESGSVSAAKVTIQRDLIGKPAEALKLSVPTILYTIQNNCILVGLNNLPAAVFHVVYQSKLVVAAMLSVIMLGRKLQQMQWVAVCMLTAGVVLVQTAGKTKEATETAEQNPVVGFVAVLTSAMCSGFAGVYFEKILKGSNTSVWVRNIQLGSGGVLVGLLIALQRDGAAISEKGFFYGYNWTVWAIIVSNAGGGLLIAIVIKYADNILKGFACAFAIVCSSIISVFLFDLALSLQFAFGASVVAASVYFYTPRPVAKPVDVEVDVEKVQLMERK